MFSKSKTASKPGSAASVAAAKGGPTTFSVLGGDVVVTGNIVATVDLHIDGQVEGDISCASLVQGEGSRVKGAITAEIARLSGEVDGSIVARELIITSTARITGDVSYETISIENGGIVQGRFSVRGAAPLIAGMAEEPLKLVAAKVD